MQQDKAIFSKWILTGLDGYVIGSDNEVYRLLLSQDVIILD